MTVDEKEKIISCFCNGVEFFKGSMGMPDEYQVLAESLSNALEKQIPKNPVKKNPICYAKSKDGEELYDYDYHCPLCDTKVNNEKHHCPCGQALDWSDVE